MNFSLIGKYLDTPLVCLDTLIDKLCRAILDSLEIDLENSGDAPSPASAITKFLTIGSVSISSTNLPILGLSKMGNLFSVRK